MYCGIDEKVSIVIGGTQPLALMFKSQNEESRQFDISSLGSLLGFNCKLVCKGDEGDEKVEVDEKVDEDENENGDEEINIEKDEKNKPTTRPTEKPTTTTKRPTTTTTRSTTTTRRSTTKTTRKPTITTNKPITSTRKPSIQFVTQPMGVTKKPLRPIPTASTTTTTKTTTTTTTSTTTTTTEDDIFDDQFRY